MSSIYHCHLFYFQNQTEDSLRQELTALQEDKYNYETTAKESLRRVLQEKLDAVRKLSDLEVSMDSHSAFTFFDEYRYQCCVYFITCTILQRSLGNTEDECSMLREMCESSQKELETLAEKHEEQLKDMASLQEKLKARI